MEKSKDKYKVDTVTNEEVKVAVYVKNKSEVNAYIEDKKVKEKKEYLYNQLFKKNR